MSDSRRLSREQLRETLRHGDPARNDIALTPEEWQEVRRCALSAEPAPVRRPWRWIPVAAGVCTVVVLVIVAMGTQRTGWWPRGDTPVVSVSIRPVADAPQPVRQIHLTGRNGTRIIWVLNPAVQF